MKKNNVLILSAGRRVELVQDFQTEAAKFSDDVKILTTDLVPRMSSACHVSDGSFEVPLISSDSYIDSIFDLAVRENIGLIIPTIDTELQKLANERGRFEAAGIHIIVSDADFIARCRDKRKTADLFAHASTLLHYIVRKAPFGKARLLDDDVMVDFSEVTTPNDKVAVIATLPLTRDETWSQLAVDELAMFRQGDIVRSDRPENPVYMSAEEGLAIARAVGVSV